MRPGGLVVVGEPTELPAEDALLGGHQAIESRHGRQRVPTTGYRLRSGLGVVDRVFRRVVAAELFVSSVAPLGILGGIGRQNDHPSIRPTTGDRLPTTFLTCGGFPAWPL